MHGFLGPVGWYWNAIFHEIFNGAPLKMAVFGWELFLAPVILVVAGTAVVRGAGPALRRQEVPEHIRSANNGG